MSLALQRLTFLLPHLFSTRGYVQLVFQMQPSWGLYAIVLFTFVVNFTFSLMLSCVCSWLTNPPRNLRSNRSKVLYYVIGGLVLTNTGIAATVLNYLIADWNHVLLTYLSTIGFCLSIVMLITVSRLPGNTIVLHYMAFANILAQTVLYVLALLLVSIARNEDEPLLLTLIKLVTKP